MYHNILQMYTESCAHIVYYRDLCGKSMDTLVSQADILPLTQNTSNTENCDNYIYVLYLAGLNSNVIGSASRGECYRYSGWKLTTDGYAWFSVNYKSQEGWIAGTFLDTASDSQCNGGKLMVYLFTWL